MADLPAPCVMHETALQEIRSDMRELVAALRGKNGDPGLVGNFRLVVHELEGIKTRVGSLEEKVQTIEGQPVIVRDRLLDELAIIKSHLVGVAKQTPIEPAQKPKPSSHSAGEFTVERQMMLKIILGLLSIVAFLVGLNLKGVI